MEDQPVSVENVADDTSEHEPVAEASPEGWRERELVARVMTAINSRLEAMTSNIIASNKAMVGQIDERITKAVHELSDEHHGLWEALQDARASASRPASTRTLATPPVSEPVDGYARELSLVERENKPAVQALIDNQRLTREQQKQVREEIARATERGHARFAQMLHALLLWQPI